MTWFKNWLTHRAAKQKACLEDEKYHVHQVGTMVQLPFSGDIIKGSAVRSIVVEHGKVIVVEDNGSILECRTPTQGEAERVRDNIAKDLNVIYNSVWCS